MTTFSVPTRANMAPANQYATLAYSDTALVDYLALQNRKSSLLTRKGIMRATYLLIGVLVFAFSRGCQDAIVSPDAVNLANEPALSSIAASKAGGAQLGGMIWADGELFGTVGTPTTFEPGQGPLIALFQGSFKDGIGAISESKPGDQDFNGGRWEVWKLKEGVTTDYSTADRVEDLNLNDFELSGVYFECPLLPMRGNQSM